MQQQVKVEEKKQGGQRHDRDGVRKKGNVGQVLVPVEEGRQTHVHQAENFGAVQRQHPDAFLLLEVADQVQTVEKQRGDGHRRDEAVAAERIEPSGVGGLHADHQRDGQTPEQSGKAAHQPAE